MVKAFFVFNGSHYQKTIPTCRSPLDVGVRVEWWNSCSKSENNGLSTSIAMLQTKSTMATTTMKSRALPNGSTEALYLKG